MNFFQEYKLSISLYNFIINEKNEYYSKNISNNFDSYQKISNDTSILINNIYIKIAFEDISLDIIFLF